MSTRRILVHRLAPAQRDRARRSFVSRRVPTSAMHTVVSGSVRPCTGDLVLAEVTRLGQHRHLEQPDGRRASLHVGDLVVTAYADRYAPDQYEAEVPTTLGPTQLVASGGIAATVLSRSRAVRSATDLLPVGLIGDERGRPLNLADFAMLPTPGAPDHVRVPSLAVCGTSMNAGKTTTNRYLVHTLARTGLRPGATKVTGTGSGNDYWVMLDAGAHQMLDFTDVGLASTYRQPLPLLEDKVEDLLALLSQAGCGFNLVEIADGVFQQETAQLLDSDVVRGLVDQVIFAAADAMGAALGVARLRELGHDVVAVSGVLTRSPLAAREAQLATGLPVLGTAELSDPALVCGLLGLKLPVAVPTADAVVLRVLHRPQEPLTPEPASSPVESAPAAAGWPLAPETLLPTIPQPRR